VLTRALVRSVLVKYVQPGVDPAALSFGKGPHGKPYLEVRLRSPRCVHDAGESASHAGAGLLCGGSPSRCASDAAAGAEVPSG
jgi:hypothetical protein